MLLVVLMRSLDLAENGVMGLVVGFAAVILPPAPPRGLSRRTPDVDIFGGGWNWIFGVVRVSHLGVLKLECERECGDFELVKKIVCDF